MSDSHRVRGGKESIPGQGARARLELRERLGEGAYSEVYRGVIDDRFYAVKVHKGAEPAEVALQRFRREAAVHAGLSHRAIPQVYEVGVRDGRPYIVTQLIDGPPLADRVSEGPLPSEALLGCALTLADALAEVHARGLVHRDIKPRNVLVDQRGGFHLIDFGLAGHDDDEAGDGAVGTLRYCAPEQLGLLERPIDGRSDLYALGALLFECATGRPPFPTEDLNELLHQQAAVTPPRVDEIIEGSCGVISDLIDKLLRKEPDDRYQSAESLLADLQDLDGLRARRGAGQPYALGAGQDRRSAGRIFVGRGAELSQLRAAWGRTQEGKGEILILEGAPGGGKSHLMGRFIEEQVSADPLLLRAKCGEGDPFPMAPIRAALRAHVETARSRGELDALRDAVGELGDLLVGLGPELSRALSLRSSGVPREDARELFYNAVASFLLALIRAQGGALLWIDDVQWLDSASIEVLRLLASRLESTPALLVLSSRDDAPSQVGLRRVREALGPWLGASIKLGPLGPAELKRILAEGVGHGLDGDVSALLVSRSQGNPLALWQYMEVMKEEGVLSPHWGTWVVDREALGRVKLPTRLYDLMVRRLGRLGASSREILAQAALLGDPVSLDVLTEMVGHGRFSQIQRALSEGLAGQLIEVRPGIAGYAFVHDRIREALLSFLPEDRGPIHRLAAEALERLGAPSPRQIFALAHHAFLGFGEPDPERAFEPLLAAAALANESHAYAKAFELVSQVESLGILAGLAPARRLAFHEVAGLACYNTERVGLASAQFEAALELTDAPLHRARLRANIAKGTVFTFNTTEGKRELALAFEELEQPLPSASEPDPMVLVGALMGRMNQTLALFAQDAGPPPLSDDARLRCEAVIDLCESGFLIGYYARDKVFSLQCGILGLAPAWRLGVSNASCRGLATFAFLEGLRGQHEGSARFAEQALGMARSLGERQTLAMTQSTAALGLHLGDHADRALALQREVFDRFGAWMGPIGFQNCCVDLINNYGLRGMAEEQLEVALKAIERLKTKDGPFMAGYMCRASAAAMEAAAALGRMEEARGHFNAVRAYEGVVPADRAVPWIAVEGFRVGYFLHQGELGPDFEAAVAAHQAWGIPADQSTQHAKHFYVLQAFGRLAILRAAAEGAPREEAASRLREAAAELDVTAKVDTLRALSLVIQANVALLDEDEPRALALLDAARTLGTEVDHPWALYEEALSRALLYRAKQKPRALQLEAQRALAIAREQGWRPRVRAVERLFGLGGGESQRSALSASMTLASTRVGGAESLHLQRKLDGFLSLAKASVRVLDPDEQARVALEECARLLGAERAYLFVVEEPGSGGLVFARGRGPDGKQLPTPEGYSHSIVTQVVETREAVLLSTGSDGRPIQSESVMAYGLRSVIAAPLLSGETLFGVLYLDNRLVRGVFDYDHVDLLLALGQHITTSIQHARAAQLEAILRGETERRHLAELLRELNIRLTSTLKLTETLRLLGDALRSELRVEHVVASVYHEDGPLPVHCSGERQEGVDDAIREILVELQGRRPHQTEVRPGPLGGSVLAIPLRARDESIGAVLLMRREETPFPRADVDLAEALVGQGGIAIENAQLFRRIKDLAERDELTGLFNRREFFRRATGFLDLAALHGGSFAALIFDVDHFKRFNDTYGHATGDEVLKIVSAKGRDALREDDVICRYGGEEFTILLPGASARLAMMVGDRVRLAVANAGYVSPEHGPLQVTISIGVSVFSPGDDLTALLGRADDALYESKAAGRNCVTFK